MAWNFNKEVSVEKSLGRLNEKVRKKMFTMTQRGRSAKVLKVMVTKLEIPVQNAWQWISRVQSGEIESI